MKHIGIGALALFALMVTIGLLRSPHTAYAQDQEQKGSIRVKTEPFKDNDEMTGKRSVMVSIIRDGKIVRQREQNGTSFIFLSEDNLPLGTYDVRAEGDNIRTITKRGITVNPKQSTDLIFKLESGEGAKVIEYATGGLSREEIAARLKKLEESVCTCTKK